MYDLLRRGRTKSLPTLLLFFATIVGVASAAGHALLSPMQIPQWISNTHPLITPLMWYHLPSSSRFARGLPGAQRRAMAPHQCDEESIDFFITCSALSNQHAQMNTMKGKQWHMRIATISRGHRAWPSIYTRCVCVGVCGCAWKEGSQSPTD